MDLRYTDYDLVGNVKQIQDYKAGNPQTQSFTYDDLNRLLSAQVSGGSGGIYSEAYAYSGNNGKIGNLTSKGGRTYTYGTQSASCPDGALSKPHAVVAAGSDTFCYDRNGNQVKRVVGGTTYNLGYDAENRLTTVSGGATATFVYGPDGERVKGTVGTSPAVTTYYIGTHYEREVRATTSPTETIRKYYYAGGTRVAMRENGTLYWLLADHLGSTAITADRTSGGKVAEVRYKAWGEDRYTSGTTPTTYRYTGQRWEAGLGLYFYRARWYDPALGRFTQPDTVVPEMGKPQNFNRFTYVQNNPFRYVDPTGHQVDETRAQQLYNYALRLKYEGRLSAMDRFEAFIAFAASLYADDEFEQFMIDVSAVIVGYEHDPDSGKAFWAGTLEKGRQPSKYWIGTEGFDPDLPGVAPCGEWKDEYDDGTRGQAFHFWFYVAVAYFDGYTWAEYGNFKHDGYATPVGPAVDFVLGLFGLPRLDQGPGVSLADYNLGQEGALLGVRIAAGARRIPPGYYGLNHAMAVKLSDIVSVIGDRLRE